MRYQDGTTAKIAYRCPECGALATAHISDCGYRWSAAHLCSARCGYAIEEDGRRIAGRHRAAVLEQLGTWQLWVLIDAIAINAIKGL
jgi:hypothetical protein